jgi:malate dehydrogenase (oxaloacetate-decarboxylating)(NADP+)
MVKRGEADAMLCGIVGKYNAKLKHVKEILGLDPTVKSLSAMSAVITPKGPFFFCDTHVQLDPTAEQIAESALQAAYRLRLFGITPKVALISHSNFGSVDTPSARKMSRALEIMLEKNPRLEAEGEMHVDAALSPEIRAKIFPDGRLEG